MDISDSPRSDVNVLVCGWGSAGHLPFGSQLTYQFVDTEDEASELLRTATYDVVLIRDPSDEDRLRGLIDLSHENSAEYTSVVVVGNGYRKFGHLRAVIAGADIYGPSDTDVSDVEHWIVQESPQPGQVQRAADYRHNLEAALRDVGVDVDEFDRSWERTTQRVDAREAVSVGLQDVIDEIGGDPLLHANLLRASDDIIHLSALPDQVANPASDEIAAEEAPRATDAVGDEEENAGSPSDLMWHTDFLEDPSILAKRPHVVAVGGEYQLTTQLSVTADVAGLATAVPLEAVADRNVSFQFSAINGKFRIEPNVEWSSDVQSNARLCGPAGVEPFTVGYRATKAGSCRVQVFLIVENSNLGEQRFDLIAVSDDGSDEPPGNPESHTNHISQAGDDIIGHVTPTDGHMLASAPPVELRLHLNQNKLMLNATLGSYLEAAVGDSDLRSRVGGVATEAYKKLTALNRFPPQSKKSWSLDSGDIAARSLAKIGYSLHRFLFDPATRDLSEIAGYLRASGRDGRSAPPVLEIHSDGYRLPWGILYDGVDPEPEPEPVNPDGTTGADPPPIDPLGFWGVRFDICRTITSRVGDSARGACKLVKPVVGDQVPLQAEQEQFLNELRAARLPVSASSKTANDLRQWAETGDESDMIYLFCHARPAAAGDALNHSGSAVDELSALGFGYDEDEGTLLNLRELAECWDKPRLRAPVVFLNACASGHSDSAFGTPFVDFFTAKWGAQAFLGTDWPVQATIANLVGQSVLKGLLEDSLSLREAMRATVSAAAKAKNYFPLMYAIYGPNNVRFSDPS